MKKTLQILLIGFTVSAVVWSCGKAEETTPEHPANLAASCNDGILNQGEYKVDCGGPCAKCGKSVSMKIEVDSIWLPDSVNTRGGWEADKIYFSDSIFDNSFYFYAIDSQFNAQHHYRGLYFVIDSLYPEVRGIYEFQDILGFYTHFIIDPGTVDLSSGIVKITNADTVNKLVSGTFEFHTEPFGIDNYRVEIIDGTFSDLPYAGALVEAK